MQKLIYIDEEPRARDLYGRRLQHCLGEEIIVDALDPEQELDAMVARIENEADLVSVVVDQKLNAAGTATYVGTELVEKLRLVDKMMPIYILTNYVDDVDQNLGGIEYVLSKDDLENENSLAMIATRVRRHVNIFQHILNERESRFEELLRKRFESTLSEKETSEYSNLKYQREKKSFASTFFESDELTKKIEAAEAKLQEIERMIKG